MLAIATWVEVAAGVALGWLICFASIALAGAAYWLVRGRRRWR